MWLPSSSSTWFKEKNNLVGTLEEGMEGDDASEWAIKLKESSDKDRNFLFASGDY